MICLSHVFTLLFISFITIHGRRSLFDGTDLPRLKDTDAIELYHLRSFPSLIVDTDVGTFSMQTSGLALRSTTTDTVIVLQYKPKNYTSSFLPRFLSSSGASKATGLSWDKRAEIIYHDNIDTSFWQQSTFLARINGIVYKNYVKWLEEYMRHHAVFRPQSICSNEFDIDACFVVADTWDSFLADSFHLFAALSVRINAIIPPRATELKFISSTEPVLVRMTNITDHYLEDSERHESRRRRRPEDDDDGDDGGEAARIAAPEATADDDHDAERRDRTRHDKQRRYLEGDELPVTNNETHEAVASAWPSSQPTRNVVTVAPSPPPTVSPTVGAFIDPNHPDIPTVHADAILRYYDALLSCMQDYERGDFVVALKSCTAEDVVYIHRSDDLYWAVTPRYPFVYLHDYLQEIPSPQFRTDPGVDVVDWSLVGFFVVTVMLGCLSTLYQIKIWELVVETFRRCCSCSGCCSPPRESDHVPRREYLPSVGTRPSGVANVSPGGTPSKQRRGQSTGTTMDRMWGMFINYRGRGQQPFIVHSGSSSRDRAENHHYSKLAQIDEEDADGVELPPA